MTVKKRQTQKTDNKSETDRTRKSQTEKCWEWKVGFRVARQTEPEKRQTEKDENGKWGSELQGT